MRKSILFIILFALVLSVSATAQNPRDMKFEPITFTPPEPIRFETDNGMVVYFLEDDNLPVLMATAYFHGGDVYDTPDKSGLASLTATLLRTGGAGQRTPDQVDQDLDFVAGSVSSNAGDEILSVGTNCLIKDIDLVFGIYADIITAPKFDSTKIELERSNMENGILRQNDDPRSVTRRIYYQTVFEGHPYGVYPTLESVGKITADDIRARHDKYYRPDNCFMAITGDLGIDDVKALVKKYFGGWKKGGSEIVKPPQAEMHYKPGVYYIQRDINQAHLRFGHLSFNDRNPDKYAFEILNFAMGGGGFTSRMVNQVRTTYGLAYSVGTYNYIRPLTGTFFGYCMTNAGTMGKALTMMMQIIDDIRQNGITEEEMNTAKESIINSYIFNYDTPSKIVNQKAYLEMVGLPPDQMERDIEAFKAVTLDDCNRVAAEYIHPDKYAIIIAGNKDLFDEPIEDFGPVMNVSLEIK